MNLPHDSYRWNKAILGSFKKGPADQRPAPAES